MCHDGWLRNLLFRLCNPVAHNCTDGTGDVTRRKVRYVPNLAQVRSEHAPRLRVER
jgi:hypothetical protein